MTKTEQKIRQQLSNALVERAQTDETIIQLRAMLGAVQELKGELASAEEEDSAST